MVELNGYGNSIGKITSISAEMSQGYYDTFTNTAQQNVGEMNITMVSV